MMGINAKQRLSVLGMGFALALVAFTSAEAATPLGPPFVANAPDDYVQRFPRVESDGTSGSFVVVWNDYYDVNARRFDRAGDPLDDQFKVNQSTLNDASDHYVSNPVAVAMDPAGGFVVVWHGYPDPPFDPYPYMPAAFLRLYDPAGNPRGDEFTTTAPTFEYDEHVNPEIAMDASGDFVVVWEGVGYYNNPGYYTNANESVFGQVYESSGGTRGAEFQADIYEIYTQGEFGYLDVARAPSGDSFVVVWQGQGPGEGSGYYAYPTYGVHGRRFLFDTGVSKQFSVATDADGEYAYDPQIAMDPDGNFTVVWVDTDAFAIEAQRFSKAGLKLGPSFVVSETEGYGPAVDADSEGNFVVVWQWEEQCRGRVLDALGNRRGGEFDVGCYSFVCSDYGCSPDVAALGGGEFVVAWAGYESFNYDADVLARRFAIEPLREVLLGGKSLQIRNGPVDFPELRRATWVARGQNVASPARGSDDDPRCNGDPSGAVKASIRFFSNVSGADTGELPLPCERWKATGPATSDPLAIQGYAYKDPSLASGLCSKVVLKRTKLVKATCKEMPYDLVTGVDQGIVHAVLTLGEMRSCTSFESAGGRDGSDGLRFQGANAPAPPACPVP